MSYNCYIACYIAYMACYITGYITPSFLFLSLPGPAAALALIKISPTLLQAPLQGHCPLLPACRSPLLPPGLSFSHRDLSWLATPVAPHPRALGSSQRACYRCLRQDAYTSLSANR